MARPRGSDPSAHDSHRSRRGARQPRSGAKRAAKPARLVPSLPPRARSGLASMQRWITFRLRYARGDCSSASISMDRPRPPCSPKSWPGSPTDSRTRTVQDRLLGRARRRWHRCRYWSERPAKEQGRGRIAFTANRVPLFLPALLQKRIPRHPGRVSVPHARSRLDPCSCGTVNQTRSRF